MCLSVCLSVCYKKITKKCPTKLESEKERANLDLENFEKKIPKKNQDLENFDFNFFQNANEKILLFYCSIVLLFPGPRPNDLTLRKF